MSSARSGACTNATWRRPSARCRLRAWVVALVDGAETQLDLVESSAAAYGVDVTVVLDIIHVAEYVWKAAHVFHREGSPELACWAWTRLRCILESKASMVAAAAMRRAATVADLSSDTRKPVDACADYDRYLAAGYNAGEQDTGHREVDEPAHPPWAHLPVGGRRVAQQPIIRSGRAELALPPAEPAHPRH